MSAPTLFETIDELVAKINRLALVRVNEYHGNVGTGITKLVLIFACEPAEIPSQWAAVMKWLDAENETTINSPLWRQAELTRNGFKFILEVKGVQ